MAKSSRDLERELEKARQREQWEAEQPEAIADAFERGRQEGWSAGWEDALKWVSQMMLSATGIHRSRPPRPAKVSLDQIADFLESQRKLAEGAPNA